MGTVGRRESDEARAIGGGTERALLPCGGWSWSMAREVSFWRGTAPLPPRGKWETSVVVDLRAAMVGSGGRSSVANSADDRSFGDA